MRILAMAALALAFALPARADDAEVFRVLQSQGLIGVWADDCAKPPSDDNGYERITADDKGGVTTVEDHADWDSTYRIVEAVRIDDRDTRVKLVHAEDEGVTTSVYRRDGNRQTTWTSESADGTPLVTEGRIVQIDRMNSWLTLCPA